MQTVVRGWAEGGRGVGATSGLTLEQSGNGKGLGILPWASGSFRRFLPSLVSAHNAYPSQADLTREMKIRRSGTLFLRKNRSVLTLGGVQEGPAEKPC